MYSPGYSAGLAGIAVDRLVETKGVSDLLGSSQADVGSDLLSFGQIARLHRQGEGQASG